MLTWYDAQSGPKLSRLPFWFVSQTHGALFHCFLHCHMWCSRSTEIYQSDIKWFAVKGTPYPVCNAKSINNLKKSLAKANSMMGVIEACISEEGFLGLPNRRCWFFNPMAGDSKISVNIVSLPSITCKVNFSRNGWALSVEGYVSSCNDWKRRDKCYKRSDGPWCGSAGLWRVSWFLLGLLCGREFVHH